MEYLGCYFRNKSDKFYQVTNFTVEPIQMLEYEDGAQISANFITYKGEKYLIHLEAPSMIDVRTFKAALAKKTFALTFLGGNGDLDQFKMFLYDMPWVKKRGVKSMGIYPRNKGHVKPQEFFLNERFALRVWLISLGLVGVQYSRIRQLLIKPLSGNSAYAKPRIMESKIGKSL